MWMPLQNAGAHKERPYCLLTGVAALGGLLFGYDTAVISGAIGFLTERFDLTADPPPGDPFDLVLSLLVLHHLEDTSAALVAIRRLLRPGGRLALADLDAEDGSFHGPDADGIHHLGFDRRRLADLARQTGFVDVDIITATAVERDGRRYPIFLLLARNP